MYGAVASWARIVSTTLSVLNGPVFPRKVTAPEYARRVSKMPVCAVASVRAGRRQPASAFAAAFTSSSV